jgi:hypothetical protein
MPLVNTDNILVSRGGTNYKTPVTELDARYQQQGQNISAASINGGSLAGFRNRIINGNFLVDLRSDYKNVTIPAAVSLYICDRWIASAQGGAVTSRIIEDSSFPGQNILRITGGAGNTLVTLGNRIESFNCADLGTKQVTFSFNTANSLRTNLIWKLTNPTVTDTYSSGATTFATGNITISATMTRYSVTVTIPAIVNRGFQLSFEIANQTSGTWTIGDVQIEQGPLDTPFERRPIQVEDILCKRYFQYAPLSLIGVATGASQTIESPINFPVSMRIVPTVGPIQVDSRPGTAPQVFQNAAQGINRVTTDFAAPFIQASGAGAFFVVGYRFPLDAEIY